MGLKLYDENDVQNIANAIREKGVSGNFKMAEMPNAISQISGGGSFSIEDFTNIQYKRYFNDNDLSYWYYYPDDDHYVVSIGRGPMSLGVWIYDYGRGYYIADITAKATGLIYLTSEYLNSDLSKSGRIKDCMYFPNDLDYWNSYYAAADSYNQTIYRNPGVKSLFRNTSTNFPILSSRYENDKKVEIKDMLVNFKPKDIIEFNTSATLTKGYLVYIPGWESVLSFIGCTDEQAGLSYNSANKKITISKCYWANPGIYRTPLYERSFRNLSLAGRDSYTYDLEDPVGAIYWNSEDILDENGNVVVPKNCDITDFI